MALRASYSQRAALRVWCSQRALRVSYSQRRLLRVWCFQRAMRVSYFQRRPLRVWCSQLGTLARCLSGHTRAREWCVVCALTYLGEASKIWEVCRKSAGTFLSIITRLVVVGRAHHISKYYFDVILLTPIASTPWIDDGFQLFYNSHVYLVESAAVITFCWRTS